MGGKACLVLAVFAAIAGCNGDGLLGGRPSTDLAVEPTDLAVVADAADFGGPDDLADLAPLASGDPCGNSGGLQAGAAWPMAGHCPTHDGRSPFRGSRVAGQRWSYAAAGSPGSDLAIGADGTVYFGARDTVVAVDSSTGKQKWVFQTPGEQSAQDGCPAIGSDGTIYIGTESRFYALSGAKGELRWVAPRGAAKAAAIAADGTVIFGDYDMGVTALDGATGAERWRFTTADFESASPAIGVDGTVYIGSDDRNLYAIDGGTGKQRWAFATQGEVRSTPAIDKGGTLYFSSFDLMFYAVDARSGKQKWARPLADWASDAALASDGTVYFGGKDGSLYALDGANGGLRWAVSTGGWTSTPIVDAAGVVYATSSDVGRIQALAGATGKEQWRFALGAWLGSPTLGANGLLYVSSGLNVYALGP